MLLERKWALYPKVGPEFLAVFANLDPLLVQLLSNRGIRTTAEADVFLDGDYPLMHDPFLLNGVACAVDRLRTAITRKELIAVYGDFDADGITSTVLLTETLAALGAKVIPYIPNRIEEGYGLNATAIGSLAERGVKVVVTVDCGIGAVEEVRYGKGLGVDMIVTDHHSIPEQLPEALSLINPRLPGCSYPFKDLAGVGVAFKLAQALLRDMDPEGLTESDLLDLVALGTVADLVPLLGENRYLVKKGIEILNSTRRIGLQEMMTGAGMKPGSIDTSGISFTLGPRLNAAGRLDDAIISFDLLSTTSAGEAKRLAVLLEEKNAERQRLTSEFLLVAREQAAYVAEGKQIVLISGEGYPAGIVGLIAGKLAEEYYKPFLVVEKGDLFGKGSARSIPGFDIISALDKCKDLLVRYGGHKQAAGFTISTERLADLDDRLQEIASGEMVECSEGPTMMIDAELELASLSWDTHRLIENLYPFGLGNPQPMFLSRNARVVDYRAVGMNNSHLRLRLSDGRGVWSAIGFRLGHFANSITSHVDLVYTVESNEWNGNTTLQLNVKDIKPSVK